MRDFRILVLIINLS